MNWQLSKLFRYSSLTSTLGNCPVAAVMFDGDSHIHTTGSACRCHRYFILDRTPLAIPLLKSCLRGDEGHTVFNDMWPSDRGGRGGI